MSDPNIAAEMDRAVKALESSIAKLEKARIDVEEATRNLGDLMIMYGDGTPKPKGLLR